MLRTYIIITLCTALIVSCSKSENDGSSNAFVTKGQTFELSNGFLLHDSAGAFRILLGNDHFDTINKFAGSQGILFKFRSPEDSVLISGEYNYSDQEILPNRGFQGGVYMYDSAFFEIDSGMVTINNQGDNWNLNINVRYNNIQSLTGIYNAELTDMDPNLLPE